MNLTSFFHIPHPSLVLAQKQGGCLWGRQPGVSRAPGAGHRVQSPPWVAVEPLLGPATAAELSYSPECWSLSQAGICAGKAPRAWHCGAVQLHFSPGLHPLLKPMPCRHTSRADTTASPFSAKSFVWSGVGWSRGAVLLPTGPAVLPGEGPLEIWSLSPYTSLWRKAADSRSVFPK